MAHKTIEQKGSETDFPKARELIEIRGTADLSLHDRRILNLFYANAGQQLCDDVQHVMGMAALRGSHKGKERVKDSIIQLMRTIVEVAAKDLNGEPATKLVPILSDTTLSDDDEKPGGQVL